MRIRDLFKHWEGPAALVAGVLILDGSPIPPNQTWFLRIVEATAEERAAIEEAGYLLKEA